MAQTFFQNKPLGVGDLSLLIRDSNGTLFDPAVITYTIYQVDNSINPPTLTAVTTPDQVPARSSIGAYYINMTIPSVWSGNYEVIWSLKQYSISDPLNTITLDFVVQQVNPASGNLEAPSVVLAANPGGAAVSQTTANLIMMVRELLSDTAPDRNYHFRPPTPGKEIMGYSTRVGFIWTDNTIIRMLQLTISQLNLWNPKVTYSFTLSNIPNDWSNIAAVGAAAKCLTGEAARWAADGEWGYSLNGVSLDINKTSAYQGLAQVYLQEFQTLAPLVTEIRPMSAGLRQARWLI